MTSKASTLSLEDKQSIQESVLRLSYAYGEADGERFVALFTDDAVLEAAWSGVVSSRIEGRDAIAAWVHDVFHLYWQVVCSHVWLGNVLVDATPAGAVTRCLFNRIGFEGQSISTGTWKIAHRKVGAEWRIAKLEMSVDGSQEEFAAKQALAAVHAGQIRRAR